MPIATKNTSFIGKLSFRLQSALLMASAISLLGMLGYLLLFGPVYQQFTRLENAEVKKDAEVWMRTLNADTEALSVLVQDWAYWDDSYQFMLDRNQAFINSNMPPDSLYYLGVNVLIFIKSTGEIVYYEELDIVNETRTQFEDLDQSQLMLDGAFTINPSETFTGSTGYINTRKGILMFASSPVVRSDSSGPARGSLIMGQLLTDSYIEEINERSEVSAHILLVRETDDVDTAEIGKLVIQECGNCRFATTKNQLAVHQWVSGAGGEPLFRVVTTHDRQITIRARSALNSVMLIWIFGGVVLFILASFALHIAAKARLKAEFREAELLTIHQLSATYAHEINSPLTGIIQASKLLKESGATIEDQVLLNDVYTASLSINKTLKNLERISSPFYKPYGVKSKIIDLEKSKKSQSKTEL